MTQSLVAGVVTYCEHIDEIFTYVWMYLEGPNGAYFDYTMCTLGSREGEGRLENGRAMGYDVSMSTAQSVNAADALKSEVCQQFSVSSRVEITRRQKVLIEHSIRIPKIKKQNLCGDDAYGIAPRNVRDIIYLRDNGSIRVSPQRTRVIVAGRTWCQRPDTDRDRTLAVSSDFPVFSSVDRQSLIPTHSITHCLVSYTSFRKISNEGPHRR